MYVRQDSKKIIFQNISGEDLFCCIGSANSEGLELEFPQYPIFEQNGQAWKCQDHAEICEKWAKDNPESCTDSNHPSYKFMKLACMESCGFCEEHVSI